MVGYSRAECYHAALWPSAYVDAAGNLHSLCDWRRITVTLMEFLEAWWFSTQPFFRAAGVVCHFERSPADRPKPSCALNFRRDMQEADLLVWESGEAEFGTIERDGSTHQQHYDDVRTPSELGALLSRCLCFAISAPAS